jgi:hypothetical protein
MLNLSVLNKKVNNFLKRSNIDKLIFIQAFVLCGIMRSLVLLVPFNKLRQHIGYYNKESSFGIEDSKYTEAKRIAWAVNRASMLTPWESKCLVQALVAQKMLKSRHIYTTLYLGVAKDGKSGLIAHAWLRCGSMIVTGGYEMDRFKEVARFCNEK